LDNFSRFLEQQEVSKKSTKENTPVHHPSSEKIQAVVGKKKKDIKQEEQKRNQD